jgi:hypothetical protein
MDDKAGLAMAAVVVVFVLLAVVVSILISAAWSLMNMFERRRREHELKRYKDEHPDGR